MTTHTTEILAITGRGGYLAAGFLDIHRMPEAHVDAAAYSLDAPCGVPIGACERPYDLIHCTQIRPGD